MATQVGSTHFMVNGIYVPQRTSPPLLLAHCPAGQGNMINCFRGPQLTKIFTKTIPATGACNVLQNFLPKGQAAGSGVGLTMGFSYIGNGYFLQARCGVAVGPGPCIGHLAQVCLCSGSRPLHAGHQGTWHMWAVAVGPGPMHAGHQGTWHRSAVAVGPGPCMLATRAPGTGPQRPAGRLSGPYDSLTAGDFLSLAVTANVCCPVLRPQLLLHCNAIASLQMQRHCANVDGSTCKAGKGLTCCTPNCPFPAAACPSQSRLLPTHPTQITRSSSPTLAA